MPDVQQKQLNVDMMIDVNAAIILQEKRSEKNSGSEWDSKPQPLHYQCNALPTELSKPYESGCLWVGPLCLLDVIHVFGSSL